MDLGFSLREPSCGSSLHSPSFLVTRWIYSLDDVIDGDVEQTVIQGLHLHGAAGEGLERFE